MKRPGLLYPDILGVCYSRTSVVDISIDNSLSIEGCDALSIQRKLTRGKSWAHRANPQGRTRGRFEYDCKMTIWTDEYNLLLDYLASIDTRRQGAFGVAFSMSVALFEENLGTTLWQLIGCSIQDEVDDEIEDSHFGDDIDKHIEFDVMTILKDGVSAGLENVPFGQIGAV
jgi:hypothetical protein